MLMEGVGPLKRDCKRESPVSRSHSVPPHKGGQTEARKKKEKLRVSIPSPVLPGPSHADTEREKPRADITPQESKKDGKKEVQAKQHGKKVVLTRPAEPNAKFPCDNKDGNLIVRVGDVLIQDASANLSPRSVYRPFCKPRSKRPSLIQASRGIATPLDPSSDGSPNHFGLLGHRKGSGLYATDSSPSSEPQYFDDHRRPQLSSNTNIPPAFPLSASSASNSGGDIASMIASSTPPSPAKLSVATQPSAQASNGECVSVCV
jgi:hypothetical protein